MSFALSSNEKTIGNDLSDTIDNENDEAQNESSIFVPDESFAPEESLDPEKSSTAPDESSEDQLTSSYDLKSFPINIDPNPIIIKKKPKDKIEYSQSISIKFLKPMTPEQPGDIIIKQEQDIQFPPALPLIIKQQPSLPVKPPTLVLRENPPKKPVPIPEKLITIPGKVLPPPPRKIVVERLPQLPQLPRDIIIEKWLGYNERFRRVVFKPAPKFVPAPAPKNTIIEWTPPDVKLNREFKLIGVSKANPSEYAAHHSESLDKDKQMSKQVTKHFKAHIKVPKGVKLGVKYKPDVPRLIGDIDALRLIDLDACGLSEYKSYLNKV